MKLFVIAALVAVAAAGRLEHLERSYLPPDSSNSLSGGFNANGGSQTGFGSGHFGASARGSQTFNQGSSGLNNGFGAHGSDAFNSGFDSQGSNGFGSHGVGSNSFGSHGVGSNGIGSHGVGSNGFGANGLGSNGASNAASLKQYLPPDQPSSGSILGLSGSSIKPACSTCGFARQQYSSQSQFGAQVPSTQYGQPQFSAQVPSTQYGQPQFGASPSFNNAPFGSPSRSTFQQPEQASRQYLAPKSQEIPQQPFDEQTGYHY